MDYKFIVTLAILLILVFLIVKEMNSIKEMMSINYEKSKNLIGGIVKDNEQKMKAGFNSCIDRIKLINGDYMVQIRKMNELGKDQIITTNSNGYIDSESCSNKKNKIIYLSEGIEEKKMRNGTQNIETNRESNFKINYSATKNQENKSGENKIQKNENPSNNDIELDDDSEDKSNNDELEKSNDSDGSETSNEDDENSEDINDSSVSSSHNGIACEIEPEMSFSENSSNNKTKTESVKSITTSSSKKKNLKNEEESLVTSDIVLTMENLKSVESYNKKFLEKAAKNMGIPVSYKDGNSRKYYVKNELYEKIVEKLSQK